ncbi:hypothetical protein GCM10009123_09460 [Kangiella japonica]|uniref:Sel1 repeat family protein n=2 Tax=Kangiella japonica TaxID=647384 RepID=A0ABP3CI74_9GAMM
MIGLAVVMLAACDSDDKSSALCETHFNAKSYKVAVKHCEKAVEHNYADAKYYLGLIYIEQGQQAKGSSLIEASASSGFYKAEFHQTVRVLLEGDDPESVAQALHRMQQYAEAGDDVAQYWMGNVFLFGSAKQKPSPNEASYWYQMAVKQNNLRAMNNLAWIKALARDSELYDPAGAVELALKVVKKYPKSHGYLDTLAAAYAANGQYELAVEVQQRVIELAKSGECKNCTSKLIEYYQRHLEHYLKEEPLEETLFD